MFRRRHLLSVVAAVYFGLLVGLTFIPGSAAVRESWLVPAVLFLPVGFLLTMLMGRRRWWVAVGFGMLGAAWVEAAQTIWMPEGYASAIDIVCSSAGSTAGVGMAVLLLTVRSKSMHSHAVPRIVSQAGE